MKKITKSQLTNFAVLATTILGMILSSKAQEQEMESMKQEIKLELKQEKED